MKKKIVASIIIAMVIAIIFFIILGHSGSRTGDGANKGQESVVSKEMHNDKKEESKVETEELMYSELKISGNEYIFDNCKYTIDEINTLIDKIDKGISIKLIDEEASEKAYESIKDALKESSIKFIE